MPRLELVAGNDIIRLDEQQSATGLGFQVHSGVVGLGLPNVNVQWLEGAGDGAVYRGSRVLPRDIDLPISIVTRNRGELLAQMSRLAQAMSQECTLLMYDDDGSSWFTRVRRVGGGQPVYGRDTVGETEVQVVLTMRAGDPYWTSSEPKQQTLGLGESRGLLAPGSLSALQVRASQTLGTVRLENPGDAPAYPVWLLMGPGSNFKATSPTGHVLHWEGVLTAGESLRIDTKTGSVVDHTGANRYAELADAPRMWRIPPGTSDATVSFDGTSSDSYIVVSWRPRKWLVI
jgi:hypothetical protein